jgi:hypothetical protein
VTDDNDQNIAGASESSGQARPDSPGSLSLLRGALAAIAEVPDGEAALGLVILANGMLIGGTAVSPEQWLRALADSRHPDDEFGKFLTEIADEVKDAPKPTPDEIQHVHLVDATVYTGGMNKIGSGDGIWQIPLNHVAGWRLGTVTGAVPNR